MMFRIFLVLIGQAVLCAGTGAAFARTPEGYSSNLAALYSEHQWVLAAREACNQMLPQGQAEIDDAFGAWRERNKELIDDLEARLAALVKSASKDQRDYSRNYARSQSEVLQQRAEERKRLLSRPRTELQQLCTDLPGYLRDARSDIPKRAPEEYAAIYRKAPP
jgi:Skp family chaperone for outer membrane proteins